MTVTIVLLVITCIVSYFALQDRSLFDRLKHWPFQEHRAKEFYRFVSSGFVHGSWIHLGINMFVLYEFGRTIEKTFVYYFGPTMGMVNFLMLYILTIIFADIPTYLKHKDNPHYASIGASGAVSGIVFVYILLAPWTKLYLYGIIPLYSIIGGLAYLAYSSWASNNRNDGIDHDAHFYGAVFGVLFTLALKPDLFNMFMDRLINNAPWM